MITSPTGYRDISSCFRGLDVQAIGTYHLDLCVDVVRSFVKDHAPARLRWNPTSYLWECESSYKELDGLRDWTGEQVGYTFSIYVKES